MGLWYRNKNILIFAYSSDGDTRNADRNLVRKINVRRLKVAVGEWKMIESLLTYILKMGDV